MNELKNLKVYAKSIRTGDRIIGYYYYDNIREKHYIKTWNNSIEIDPDTVKSKGG